LQPSVFDSPIELIV